MDSLWDEDLEYNEIEANDENPWKDGYSESEWGSETDADAEMDRDADIPSHSDVPEATDDPTAPISTATLLEQAEVVSVERLEDAARTEKQFQHVVDEWDRLDRKRQRRERYYEILCGDSFPEDTEYYSGRIFPQRWMRRSNGSFSEANSGMC